jgi:TonB family protein
MNVTRTWILVVATVAVVGPAALLAQGLKPPSDQSPQNQLQLRQIASGFGAGAYPAGIAHPTVTDKPSPKYPKKATQAGISGEVLLDALVGPTGAVVQVQVSSMANSILDEPAAAAVRAWRFLPARLNGENVSAVVPVSVKFYFVRDGKRIVSSNVESRVLQRSDELWPSDLVDVSTPGMAKPRVTREIKPAYTMDAMVRKVQGSVELLIVVGIDGNVSHARVAKSLDTGGLDSQALLAARQWTFSPCQFNNRAVPCAVTLDLHFRLK